MKIAISRPTQDQAETIELFRSARELGFDGIQMKPGQYQGLDADQFRQRYGTVSELARALRS